MFIYSSVDQHFRCFNLLAINNAVLNVHVEISEQTFFQVPGYICRSEIAGYMVTICLTFWGKSFPKGWHRFILPPAKNKGSSFPHPHEVLLLSVIYLRHPNGYEVVSPGAFDLHFPSG